MSGPADKSFRQSQSFLHTWSGLVLGWLLFLIFLCGTIAFWREGMNRWMRPELARISQPMTAVAGAQRFLEKRAGDAKTWFITVPSERSAGAQLFWIPMPKEGEQPRRRRGAGTEAIIGADGQPATARETRGGDFFYRFHFDLHYIPVIWARWLVGLATMMMLVAILSGIVTHKKIFRDFFTLRRGKGQRSWLDGHNATAVLALPFHLMITYTGLVALMAMLMPWAVVANYTDRDKLFETAFPEAPAVERADRRAPLVDLRQVVADAERRFGGPVGSMRVSDPGDASARIEVNRASTSMLSSHPPSMTYDGVTGKMIWASPAPGAAVVTSGAMIGLHAGRYADVGLRWVYFLCGVAGTLMVASGLVLWTVKRREKLPNPERPHFGFRMVERLNVAFIGGFPLGVAAMFWGNRLIPTGIEGRADWEIASLFATWGVAFLASMLVKPRTMWLVTLGATGALLGLLPFYNMVATPRGFFAAIAEGDVLFAAVDATILMFAVGFLATARAVWRFKPAVRRVRARRTAAVAPIAVLEAAE